jgi:hypothetical protein
LALTKSEMLIPTFTNGTNMPVSYPTAAHQETSGEEARISANYFVKPTNGVPNGNGSNSYQSNGTSHTGIASNGVARMKFQNPYGACNFIVTWDGENVNDVLDAIRFARASGDRFIQDKLIEYILNIPLRHPRPLDIPAFVGRPVWAVDAHGRALVGMPGAESIVDVEWLRRQVNHPK